LEREVRIAHQEELAAAESGRRLIESILDEARWAPSGDNTQPWRFELRGTMAAAVHEFDTRAHCVFMGRIGMGP
jgi:nitroreductase